MDKNSSKIIWQHVYWLELFRRARVDIGEIFRSSYPQSEFELQDQRRVSKVAIISASGLPIFQVNSGFGRELLQQGHRQMDHETALALRFNYSNAELGGYQRIACYCELRRDFEGQPWIPYLDDQGIKMAYLRHVLPIQFDAISVKVK